MEIPTPSCPRRWRSPAFSGMFCMRCDSVSSSSRHEGAIPELERRLDGAIKPLGVDHLADRQVDRDLEVRPHDALPLADLRACMLDHPFAYRHDEPGILGHVDEFLRHQQSPARMLP